MPSISDSLFLKQYPQTREQVLQVVVDFLAEKSQLCGDIYPQAKEVAEKLIPYAQGKALRAYLLTRGYEWFSGNDPELKKVSYKVGAAIEFLQAGFLIHDDIIDQDTVRRGQPSMHVTLAAHAKQAKWRSPEHAGESIAIVLADMCYFWIQEIILKAALPAEKKVSLLSTLNTEAVNTGVGEIVDVIVGIKPLETVTLEEVKTVNTYKTARYTVALPLLLAADLAATPEDPVLEKYKDSIISFGEIVGEIFQLRDDELGLFGSEEDIGKSVGSDIREGKRTVWWCELLERCSENDTQKLLTLSGKADISLEEVVWVRELVKTCGVHALMQEHIQRLKTKALAYLEKLPFSPEHKQEAEAMVAFIANREK